MLWLRFGGGCFHGFVGVAGLGTADCIHHRREIGKAGAGIREFGWDWAIFGKGYRANVGLLREKIFTTEDTGEHGVRHEQLLL